MNLSPFTSRLRIRAVLFALLVLPLVLGLVDAGPPEKINGVSFVASRKPAEQRHIDPVLEINANHASVMPFAFLRGLNSCELTYNSANQWYGERFDGARQYIEMLHGNGIRVMLKPQIWVWKGAFTGNIEMKSESDWEALEDAYEDFIMLYARLAQETGVEIFCVGTELDRFVQSRPGYWKTLIHKVSRIYDGKITYAANWDEYARFPLWADLDFIGVDAYFPLSEKREPDYSEMSRGWQRWKTELADCARCVGRPVLFTEYGYRSMDYSVNKPWRVDRNQMDVNLDLQAEAYRVLFDELWGEYWFAGGFLWKWFIEHDRRGGPEDNRFTPQNKPAQGVVAEYYGRQESSSP